MLWTPFIAGSGATVVTLDPNPAARQDNASAVLTGGTHGTGMTISEDGALTYSGPGGNAAVDWTIVISGQIALEATCTLEVAQDGVQLLLVTERFNGTYGGGTTTIVLTPGIMGGSTITASIGCGIGVTNVGGLSLSTTVTLSKIE